MKKTLALAAVTALTLSFGTAFAQLDGPSAPMSNDPDFVRTPAPVVQQPTTRHFQAGSSDVQPISPYNYGTLNSPG
jgi:hypothetical protein